jgi:hypothetical protein
VGTYYGSVEFQGVDKSVKVALLLKNGYITGNTRSQTGISLPVVFQPVSDSSDEVSFQSLTLLEIYYGELIIGALSKIL